MKSIFIASRVGLRLARFKFPFPRSAVSFAALVAKGCPDEAIANNGTKFKCLPYRRLQASGGVIRFIEGSALWCALSRVLVWCMRAIQVSIVSIAGRELTVCSVSIFKMVTPIFAITVIGQSCAFEVRQL